MKIVQEYLKTLDPDKLYDTYCSKYGAFKDVSAMSVPPEVMQKIREYYFLLLLPFLKRFPFCFPILVWMNRSG